MTISTTFLREVKNGPNTYTVAGSPYILENELAHRFIARGWATGTPVGGPRSVTLAQDYKSGTSLYSISQTYSISQPLADLLVSENFGTSAGGTPSLSAVDVEIITEFTAPSLSIPGGVIDTLTITNNSGSTLAANFVTDIFGLAFKQGDIASGSSPRIELTDGTLCPATFSAWATWPDGSIKNGYGFCRVPESLAGSGTKTLNIKSGTAPAASGFTTANINATAGRDFKVTLTGIDNLSGVWTSAVNTGVSDNDMIYKDCDGEAGALWAVGQELRDASSNHAHLVVRNYVRVAKDAAGNAYDWLWCPHLIQPKMNTASPARRSFAMELFDGATAFSAAAYMTASATVTYADVAGRLTWTAHGLSNGEAFILTNSGGALPAGLSANTIYFAKVIDANTIEVWTSAYAVETGAFLNQTPASPVAFSTAGTGTHTASRRTVIDHHGGIYGMQADAKWQWVAGSAAARPNLMVLQSKTYQHATKLFPALDLSLTPNAPSTLDYAPNTAGGQRRFIGAGGPHEQIGLLPAWSVRHFLRRDLVSERVSRVNGLVTGHIPIWVYDETTRQFPVYNNKSYSGLPVSNVNLRYTGNPVVEPAYVSGLNQPSSQWENFSSYDTSHNCAAPTYQYLVFGGPIYREIIANCAGMATLGRYTAEPGEGRQITIGGTTYYAGAMFNGTTLARVDAWSFRDQVGSFLLPDTHPDGTASTTHYRDLARTAADAFVAWRNSKTAQYRSSGIYEYVTRADGQGSPWSYPGYLGWAWAWGHAISGDADIATVAQHVSNFYSAITTAQGMFGLSTGYMMGVNSTDHGGNSMSTANVITDPALICFGGDSNGAIPYSVNSTTDIISVSPTGPYPTFQNGDAVVFNTNTGGGAAPGGLSGYVPYYMRDVSGNTFKLAATPGGVAIDLTNTASGAPLMMAFAGAGAGPTGTDGILPSENYEGSYAAIHFAVLCQMIASGLTGLTNAKAQIDTIKANGTYNFASNPIHAYQPSF